MLSWSCLFVFVYFNVFHVIFTFHKTFRSIHDEDRDDDTDNHDDAAADDDEDTDDEWW